MPIDGYGVLKAAVADRRIETTDTPHYQIHLKAGETDFRCAVNIRSQTSPPDLLYLAVDDFRHPVTDAVAGLADGFTPLDSKPGGAALDFVRGNLFDRTAMRPAPTSLPGPDNDLGEFLDHHVQKALNDQDARVFAFGQRWGPEDKRDKIFGFAPGNGVHDIHMNQGNTGRFTADDGVWQDGGLLIRLSSGRWIALFLAFGSQSWHTDDTTGHTIPDTGDPGPAPGPGSPDSLVRIVGALVNPVGPAPEHETVTLLNASPGRIVLDGWSIADRLKNRLPLSGTIEPGAALAVPLAPPVQLGNGGGAITLLNADGLKVDGVAYTREQASREGWTLVF
ncbi:DUF2278 family protein [Actinomadura decatromicini]|uniref:DUF2278 family protein n=1 Tax=Actinomadura decatromicini TaxID=2604572 RepID=A0A5D3FT85_9ACTN|nr:DUF2278 family protein [Actinomadura decatromicini]TYK51252.1 DUF2278 family protein [Actinomadura decatromicini]